MRLAEALETPRIHRLAGLTSGRTAVVATRSFRAPCHTISAVDVIGGGRWPPPREVSLVHHGLLWLDERPEFKRGPPEILRRSLSCDVWCSQGEAVSDINWLNTLAEIVDIAEDSHGLARLDPLVSWC
jgi:Magnesium chelatase, subunit ChlI